MTAADTAGLTFRQNYLGNGLDWAALVLLLQDTFGIDIDPLLKLGGPDPTSMPFGWFTADGVLAANLSAFAMPLVLNGRRINAAALQSGAVRPPWRGRGLYRDLTTTALAWCEAQGFEAIILYTDKPTLYEPHGFRSLDLHRYVGKAPNPLEGRPAQRLWPRETAHLVLLQDLLNRRTPVSETLAVVANAAMFLINTEFDPDVRVSYLPGHTAAVAWTMPAPEHFCLLDVVAPDIPSFAAILGSLGISPTIAETRFRPDKLGWSGEPIALEGDARLMLRGLDGVRLDHAAMLSPMADF